MRYDNSKATVLAMSNLGKGSEYTQIQLSQACFDMHNPLFRCFSLSLAHKSASQKISIPTVIEGKFAKNDPTGSRKWG